MAILTCGMRRLTSGALLAAVFAASSTVVAAAGSNLVSATGQRVDEYRLKAALIYAIAKFVDWPDAVFAAPSTPVHVCVLGADPFGPALDDTFKGHTVGGHPVNIKRVTDIDPVCHVLFVSRSERKRMAFITDQLRSSAVLTVSEEDGFRSSGGMVELYSDGDKVRFSLNLKAFEAARLKPRALLLQIYHQQGGGDRP
jgi:hypothetical protein